MRRLAPALALAIVVLAAPAAPASSPNALWRVVHELCVTDMKISGLPAPCLAVDLRGGWAALKDLKGRTQVLLIPTRRTTGIESPALLQPGAPNYWQDAWYARRYFERAAGREAPRQDIGMAINSRYGRSQDQLHIHIDCVRGDVRDALAAHQDEIGEHWAPLVFTLQGKHYIARRLKGAELDRRNPFKLLARDGAARADMGAQTLAVIGAEFADGQPGFYLLAAKGGVPDNPDGASEELLDHDCAVLARP
jgi:CDP-diacylglycerol pyrophosphatase